VSTNQEPTASVAVTQLNNKDAPLKADDVKATIYAALALLKGKEEQV